MPRIRRLTAAALAGTLLLATAGCTAASPGASPSPSASAVPAGILALASTYPATFTTATATKETQRLADAVQALFDKSTILNVDDHQAVVPATSDAPAYFGIIRAISVDQKVDPIALANTIASLLRSAGWSELKVSDDTNSYSIALSSDGNSAHAWLLILTGDATVAAQPVVTVQLASPDLPS